MPRSSIHDYYILAAHPATRMSLAFIPAAPGHGSASGGPISASAPWVASGLLSVYAAPLRTPSVLDSAPSTHARVGVGLSPRFWRGPPSDSASVSFRIGLPPRFWRRRLSYLDFGVGIGILCQLRPLPRRPCPSLSASLSGKQGEGHRTRGGMFEFRLGGTPLCGSQASSLGSFRLRLPASSSFRLSSPRPGHSIAKRVNRMRRRRAPDGSFPRRSLRVGRSPHVPDLLLLGSKPPCFSLRLQRLPVTQ